MPLPGCRRGFCEIQAPLGLSAGANWINIGIADKRGKRCGVPEMATLVREIIDRTPAALAVARQAIPAGFPAAIADSILGGVQAAAQRLGDDMAAMPRGA